MADKRANRRLNNLIVNRRHPEETQVEDLMTSSQPARFHSIPSATGGIARLACARLREFGKDATAVITEVGARPEQVYDDAIRLEVPKQIKILELVSEELQDALLGFHLARNFDLREVGLVYYVIASSERFADSLLNAKRYCTIMNEGVRLQVRQDDRTVSITLDYVDIERQSDRHQIEFWLVTMVRICRQVTDTRLALRHLRIRHRRDETPADFKSFFGCDVEFGADSDEIILPASVASLPIVGRDNYLNDLLRQYAETALADRPQGARDSSIGRGGGSAAAAPTRQSKYVERRQTASHEHANAVTQAPGRRVWRLRQYWRKPEQLLQRATLPNAICRYRKLHGC